MGLYGTRPKFLTPIILIKHQLTSLDSINLQLKDIEDIKVEIRRMN